MSDPRVQAAVLAAIITGAVALAAIIGTVVTTWRTLRHQQDAEDHRSAPPAVASGALLSAVTGACAAARGTR